MVKQYMFRRCLNGEWYCVIMPSSDPVGDAERYGWVLDGEYMGSCPSWLPVWLGMAWIKFSRWLVPVYSDKINDLPG